MKKGYAVRKARLDDVKPIQALINGYAKVHRLLPRSLNYLYDNIRDFWVVENKGKTIIACCALHVVWDDLAEIKSLVVKKNYQKQNIGKLLVETCYKDAKTLGVKRLFALTYEPGFFIKCKFVRISKNRLPAKVWKECIDCHFFPDCDEVALIRKVT